MLPIQQKVRFLQKEINPAESEELSLRKQAIPVMQISNVQEQPSTSNKSQLAAETMQSHVDRIGKPCQQEALSSLLMMMLEAEKFIHFEDQIAGMGQARADERCNNLELVSVVLRARAALFNMKTHIAGLISFRKKECISRIKSAEVGIAAAMDAFYKKGLEYYLLLEDVINNEKKTQPSGKRRNRQGYAPRKKEKAERAFKISSETYAKECKKRNLENYQITNYLREYFHEQKFIAQTARIFCSLSISEIQNIIKNLAVPQVVPSTVQPVVRPHVLCDPASSSATTTSYIINPSMSPHLNVSAPTLPDQETDAGQETEFKILRKPVSEAFWHSLDENLSRADYIKKFYQFICSNWNNDYEHEKALKKKLLKTKKENNLSERYKLLYQRCFQRKLKAYATRLIYHILKVKNDRLESEKLSGDELIERMNQRSYSISKINKIAEDHYHRYYLKYQQREEHPTQLTNNHIVELEKKMTNAYRDLRPVEEYISSNVSDNLEFINSILKLLKEQKAVTPEGIIQIIRNEKNLKRSNFSEVTKRPHDSSQKQDQPPQKKLLVSDAFPVLASDKRADYGADQFGFMSFNPLPLMPQKSLFEPRKPSFVIENSGELNQPAFQTCLMNFKPVSAISASATSAASTSTPAALATSAASATLAASTSATLAASATLATSASTSAALATSAASASTPATSAALATSTLTPLASDQARFTPFIDNSKHFYHSVITPPSTASEYLESAAIKVETDQRYRNIFYELLSVENSDIVKNTGTEKTPQSVLSSSFQDNQTSLQRESLQRESFQKEVFQAASSLNQSSELSLSEIEATLQSPEPISQNEMQQAAFSTQYNEKRIDLSVSEEDENELQDILPEIDLQTYLSDEVDFNDHELINSLEHMLNDHLYQF